MRLFKLFDPWCRLKRRLDSANSYLIYSRRLEWRAVTRFRIKEILDKAIKELELDGRFWAKDFTQPSYCGEHYVNLHSVHLIGPRDFSGIQLIRYEEGQVSSVANVMEEYGHIVFAQTDVGIISVSVVPTKRSFPLKFVEHKYMISGYYEIQSILKQEDKEKTRYILLGFYEPWQLSKKKIKKLIACGIRVIHETQQNEHGGWYTRWLFLRETDAYKGIKYGVIASLSVYILIEIIKQVGPWVIKFFCG